MKFKKIIVFLYKCINSLQEAFINSLEPCRVLFMMDGCTFWGFKISTPIHCHFKSWKSQDIFYITRIVFIRKRKSYTLAWGWANLELIQIFGWTIPLKYCMCLCWTVKCWVQDNVKKRKPNACYFPSDKHFCFKCFSICSACICDNDGEKKA